MLWQTVLSLHQHTVHFPPSPHGTRTPCSKHHYHMMVLMVVIDDDGMAVSWYNQMAVMNGEAVMVMKVMVMHEIPKSIVDGHARKINPFQIGTKGAKGDR